jgi:hypothetical protein
VVPVVEQATHLLLELELQTKVLQEEAASPQDSLVEVVVELVKLEEQTHLQFLEQVETVLLQLLPDHQ